MYLCAKHVHVYIVCTVHSMCVHTCIRYTVYSRVCTCIQYVYNNYIHSGDNEKEELLTIEYFKLLNEKNALIKKQIELNLL